MLEAAGLEQSSSSDWNQYKNSPLSDVENAICARIKDQYATAPAKERVQIAKQLCESNGMEAAPWFIARAAILSPARTTELLEFLRPKTREESLLDLRLSASLVQTPLPFDSKPQRFRRAVEVNRQFNIGCSAKQIAKILEMDGGSRRTLMAKLIKERVDLTGLARSL